MPNTVGMEHPQRLASKSAIRVLIADDDALVIQALARLIEGESDMVLVAMARDAREAADLAMQHRPDVALVDVRMDGGGPWAARSIRRRSPHSEVLAFSAHDDRADVLDMLSAGASGYVLKGASGADVLDAVRRTAAGRTALSVGVTADVVSELVARLGSERARQEGRRRAVDRIRRALTPDGMQVVFQPIFDLATGSLVGMEALSRFPFDPNRAPETWFEEASLVDLRTELEMAAIRTSLGRMDDLPEGTFLAVNLSPETACSAELHRAVEFALSPSRLVLEVTEHARVRDYARLGAAVAVLRDKGVRLAVDDAGSGFASLQHILRLAPDFIKLDMALTRDVDSDLARRALAAALISFASQIGAEIIAEGVETGPELDTLRELGVGFGQGFHLGRPAALALRDAAGLHRISRTA
jgi:EAL domain-containing protein (putative c-di-GMP-specific phosphodiesterase class I)/CheY-like chemotaxis protein